jgi:hypothetical protein
MNTMALAGLIDAFELADAHLAAIHLTPVEGRQRTAEGIAAEHADPQGLRSRQPAGRP